MISDFLTSEWGRLMSKDGTEVEKIVMATLMQMTSWCKLTRPLTFLKTVHLDLQQDYFSLIMLQAIKNVHQMRFQRAACPRTQIMDGHTTKMVPRCDQLCLQMGKFKILLP